MSNSEATSSPLLPVPNAYSRPIVSNTLGESDCAAERSRPGKDPSMILRERVAVDGRTHPIRYTRAKVVTAVGGPALVDHADPADEEAKPAFYRMAPTRSHSAFPCPRRWALVVDVPCQCPNLGQTQRYWPRVGRHSWLAR